MTLHGTDISGWQAATVNLTGLDFVIVKATEGTGYASPNYAAQIAEAHAQHKLIGRYHFAGGGDPVAEAQFFVRVTADRVAGEIQVLDAEAPFTTTNPNPVAWSVAFLNEVKRLTGNMPLIYMNASDRASHDWRPVVALNAGLWDAEYNPVGPTGSAPWPFVAIWQNSDTNQTGGDSDVFMADAAAWLRYGGSEAVVHLADTGSVTPAPRPAPRPAPPAAAPTGGPTTWIVDPGNTTSYIAGQVGVSLAALLAVNPGLNPNLIYPGQRLRLPAGAKWPANHAAPVVARPGRPTRWIVDPGDTLSAIAAKSGVTLAALEAANPGINYNLIQPRQVLNLPAGAHW